MKVEAWIFAITTAFFVVVSPAYWLIAGDWTGTSALVMTTLLAAMVTLYLGFHAAKMEPRPEDRKDGEIADGAGELGFFPPYSWWPLWCAASLAVIVYARRDRRLVAGHHRLRAGCRGAVGLGVRVLPRRARSLTSGPPSRNRSGVRARLRGARTLRAPPIPGCGGVAGYICSV